MTAVIWAALSVLLALFLTAMWSMFAAASRADRRHEEMMRALQEGRDQ